MKNTTYFQKLTPQMVEAIEKSLSLSKHYKNEEVQCVHFIWGQLTNSDSSLSKAFKNMNIDTKEVELNMKKLMSELPKSDSSKEKINFSNDFTKSLEAANTWRSQNGDKYLAIDTWFLANIENEPLQSILKNSNSQEFTTNLKSTRLARKYLQNMILLRLEQTV